MADEALINRLYTIVDEITRIGGEQENTSITPGVEVANANPGDLPIGYIKIVNPKDGTYVPCLTVNGLVVADNDLLNVLFTKGTEPIALSQSSQSPSNSLKVSEVWDAGFDNVVLQITDADDVGIGTSGPDAKLDILDAAGAQLRLTHTDGSKFVDFTLDTNHDLTITPSSTGQIILQPTTDSIDFFQVLDADGGIPVINVDSISESLTIGTTSSSFVRTGTTITTKLFIESPDASALHGFTLLKESDTRTTAVSFLRARAGSTSVSDGDSIASLQFMAHDGTDYNISSQITAFIEGSVSANTVPGKLTFTTTTTNAQVIRLGIWPDGNIKIGPDATPGAKLHVYQDDDAGVIPVLLLDQADLSEEFIDFNTTVGAGNPIDTTALGSYYGKGRVAINGTFKYFALYNP